MANRVVVLLCLLHSALIIDLSYLFTRCDTTIFTLTVDHFALCAILCNRGLVFPSMSQSQQGLLSSVLGYLSREVQDFVSTATGGSEVNTPWR
jgi:hypothetical protein